MDDKTYSGPRAAAYWQLIHNDFDLTVDEENLLVEVCAVIDTIDTLSAVLKEEGLIVAGKSGPKPHPAAAMIRQERILLARLVRQLNFPDPDHPGESPATARARKAAHTRWDRDAHIRETRKQT